jgi:hypothetical protein
MHNILHVELGLVKQSAHWVPKLLSPEQKEERVWICTEFVAAVDRSSMAMLDQIITMDETMVSYHTPQTKRQSKQWIKKGKPGPIKAKVYASQTKQMLLAFFDSKGLVYTHIIPKGTAINANYILVVLEEEEAGDDEGKLVFPLGQRGRPHRCQCRWPPRASSYCPTPPIRLIWRQRTSSCSKKLMRSWLAFTGPRRAS